MRPSRSVATPTREFSVEGPRTCQPERFRAEFMGTNWGTPADMLYYILGGYRSCQAVAHLHDVPVRPENDRDLEVHAAYWDVRDEFGVKEAEWLPYWRNSEQVKVSPEGCYASVWKHPEGRVLAVVSNLTEETLNVTVDLAALGLQGDPTAREPVLGEHFTIEGAKVRLRITPQDWRAVWIEAAKG